MPFTDRTFGRTKITIAPLGLATGTGTLPAREVERAFAGGIRTLYWGSYRAGPFGRGIRALARTRRDEMTLIVQSYTRSAALMPGSLERALRELGTAYADLLLLGWWNQPPPPRILEAALKLQVRGLVKHLMISGHNRHAFATFAQDPAFGAIMVRYNAAHPGAETEVFPHLGENPPGVATYTATRWGHLLNPAMLPKDEPPPRASDCYRFALSQPAVNLTMCAPRNAADLDEALATLERGPMSADELAWMKRVGAHVKQAAATRRSFNPIEWVDRTFARFTSAKTAGLNSTRD